MYCDSLIAAALLWKVCGRPPFAEALPYLHCSPTRWLCLQTHTLASHYEAADLEWLAQQHRGSADSQPIRYAKPVWAVSNWFNFVYLSIYPFMYLSTFFVQSNPPCSLMCPLRALLFLNSRPHSGHSTGWDGLGTAHTPAIISTTRTA